jgi:hypothetical protein
MIKCGKGKRIIQLILIGCLLGALMISSGCKKKDQSEETRQAVPEEEAKKISVSKKVEPVGTSEKINLRILYVGAPILNRPNEFIEFLSRYFEKVTAIDKIAFDEDKTSEFDVIVLDEIIKISREYSRSTVTIGIAGTKIGDYLDLKTGYL